MLRMNDIQRLTLRQSVLLNVMVMALGALDFANAATKSGGSGKNNGKTSAQKPAEGDTPPAEGEQEKAKRPALTINSLQDIDAMPETEKKALLDAAGTRANIPAGTAGKYVTADGKGVTDDKTKAKRAMGGSGRLIAQYTPPRPADVVAAEELIRMTRLRWSLEARAKCVELQSKRKTPLTDDDILKVLNDVGAPPSYLRPKASKRLYGRVLSFCRHGAPAELTQKKEEKAS